MKKTIALYTLILICSIGAWAQGVPAYVPTSGLVAYYGFEGNANDLSGNNNNGTLQSETGGTNPTPTADRFGTANSAYAFGGVDNRNWVKINNSSSLMFSQAMSVSFWMKQTSARGELIPTGTTTVQTVNNGAHFTLIAKGGVGQPEGVTPPVSAGFRLQSSLSATYDQDFQFANTNTSYVASDVVAASTFHCYSPDQWIHVVYTLSATHSRFYINGVLYQEDVLATAPNFTVANTKPLYIGRLDGGDYIYFPFSGAMDDIAFYNREITHEEVHQLYHDYNDPLGANNRIVMDSVRVINPCGANAGQIRLYPHPQSGVTYQYALNQAGSPQASNQLTADPGTVRAYVVSNCALWDTVITLVCDCTSDPTLTFYDSICPGESGQRGSVVTVVDYQFNSNDGWTFGGNWERNNVNSNYSSTPDGWGWYLDSPTHRGYSGFSAMCPTYFYMVGYSETHILTSPAINITCDPSRATLTFYYLNEDIIDDQSGYGSSTLYLEWARSASGPWTAIGGSMGNSSTWRLKTVSLAPLGSSGTYYFRIRNVGNGYVAGIDNFKITCDTRWTIPTAVTAAAGGTTVPISNVLENTGLCPITETTLWFVKPNTQSETTVYQPESYTWNGRTYSESGTYTKTGMRNHYGCDSSAVLHLVIDIDNREEIFIDACDSYQWQSNGRTYTTSTTDSITGLTNIFGGDSVAVLHLSIHPSSREEETVHQCQPFFWEGTSYSESADATVTLTSSYGCDSVRTLHFFRHHKDTTELIDSVCDGETRFFDGSYIAEEGHYTAHLTNIAGCDSTVFLSLSVISRPDLNTGFSFDCATGRYILWGETCSECIHRWSCEPTNDELAGHETDDSLFLQPKTNTIYTFLADRAAGRSCPSSVEVTLPTIIDTRAILNLQPTYLSIDQLTLTAIDASVADGTREWYINGELLSAAGRELRYTARPDVDSVLVTLAINNGVCSDTTSAVIPLIRTSLYVPNVFIPTLPGTSDVLHEANNRFRAQGTGITAFEMNIYNRAGILMFHSTDINQYWDGTYQGILCPQGAYSFIIKYKDPITPGNWQYTTGTVTLLH
ncbi:MAG: gliding motility-associated C-terminal domain-containing protein [Bacteroidales bacterium]|nr:gliding motility-associated C-terminal domain-containing protein [Bacteroidales bacterium]